MTKVQATNNKETAMHLFDPEPFTKGQVRKPRVKSKQPEPERVRLGSHDWALVSVSKSPECHAILHGEAADRARREMQKANYGAAITMCRKAGTLLTYEPGTVAAACPNCVAAGALVAEVS